jgi:hypothetical protein
MSVLILNQTEAVSHDGSGAKHHFFIRDRPPQKREKLGKLRRNTFHTNDLKLLKHLVKRHFPWVSYR